MGDAEKIRDDRIKSYYQESARDLAERIVLLEDMHQEVMGIVGEWCVEANDVGGVDATDLAFRLDAAGYRLPDDED